ncbi:MAG: IS66 family insertion sequence element accessory protein TnpB [Methylobacter tundripaludum]|jgi:hypothetical protein|nr:IS66 family insertion sequence element accessory protein TnpB [Methylobacter tundripaludum]
MKINAHWQRHVKAWRESGLSQADYCRQQGINPKTFSAWARRALPIDKNTPLDVVSVQVAPSPPTAAAEAGAIFLRLAHGVQLELSTAVSPRWLAELLRCLA